MKWTPDDLRHMERALMLAERGARTVAPNPMVGCVIVSEDCQVIGEGWHEQAGKEHAEVNAWRNMADSNRPLLAKSTWYITLEPCNHVGRTPPCTSLIERISPQRVVIACSDPNPDVTGGGVLQLRSAGIQVETGCLEQEAQWQNRRFFWNAAHRQPWVVLKWAQCQNGYMDPRSHSQRIPGAGSFALTGDEARAITHDWRSMEQAIAIGSNTALVDTPQLNVRDIDAPSPRIVLLDPSGELPPSHPLFNSNPNLIHVIGRGQKAHSTFACYWDIHEGTDALLTKLYDEFALTSMLIEGGATVLQAFIESGTWNEIKTWTSAKKFQSGLKAPSLPNNAVPPPYAQRGPSRISTSQGTAGTDRWKWFVHSVGHKQ